ncbi:transcriptional regulator family: Fungal Specific TF [Paecilomyces variotii]|nr:transcriptional regulator family: Fungal Specific TF [Paecilomyces variotii]
MSQRSRKLQRASKACDFCNRRSIKCNKNNGPLAPCQNCEDFGVRCTYDRPTKRRGARKDASPAGSQPILPAASGDGAGSSSSRPARQDSLFRSHLADPSWDMLNPACTVAVTSGNDGILPNSWKAFAIACQSTIMDLAQVYFEIVYPIFPLFHRSSFLKQLENSEHLQDQGLFASTMAMCALASARARDGALYSNRWNLSQLANPPSEVFLAAAKESIPRDLAAAKGTEYMRACAILSIASIQNGQIHSMQQYSGIYHTLSGMEGLYDERLWPRDLNHKIVEVRRRMFWSMYTLDVYSSIVWGGVIRYREAQSNVRYPGELDDDTFTDNSHGVSPTAVSHGDVHGGNEKLANWMLGWNFTTDLYRILEHAVDCQRRRSPPNNGTADFWSLFFPTQKAGSSVMKQVLAMYSELPSQFREIRPVTGDPTYDIVGFQSANIQATLQLLRMVISSNEEQGVDEKCDVAGQVLSVFSKVPVEYLKAISSPLLHHLGGIGYMLGSVMEGRLSGSSYQRVRALLLEMAELLHRLESGLRRSTGTSERLKAQVGRIDEYMRTQGCSNFLPGLQQIPISEVDDIQGRFDLSVNHQNNIESTAAAPTGFDDQLSQFQLPPELLEDWPWSLDSNLADGVFPMTFIN